MTCHHNFMSPCESSSLNPIPHNKPTMDEFINHFLIGLTKIMKMSVFLLVTS